MRVLKKKKQRGSIILRIAVFAFAAFVAGSLLSQQVQIAEKRRQLEEIQEQTELQNIENQKLEHILESDDISDAIEQEAREMGWAKSNEKVIVNIAGN